MNPELLRLLIWTDYRLAVLLAVGIPLVLLIWAFVQKVNAIQQLLIIYWRVSSLLGITLYLMIAGFPIAFITSLCAQILIPISLWFWNDINEEIDDRRGALKLTLSSWRWAMSVYCALGAAAMIPFLRCVFAQGAITYNEQGIPDFTSFCGAWLELPVLYREYFHASNRPQFLGIIAMMLLIVYALYFMSFVFLRLGKQGRSALERQ